MRGRRWNRVGASGDWPAAARLIGSLGLGSNRQEQAYLDYLVTVAEDLVDTFWPQIEALANELLNRELMSGAEVRTFLSARPTGAQNGAHPR